MRTEQNSFDERLERIEIAIMEIESILTNLHAEDIAPTSMGILAEIVQDIKGDVDERLHS